MRRNLLIVAALVPMAAGWLCGQPPRSSFPWWESPMVNTLGLSDSQTKQIQATVSDYRDKLRDLRAAINSADADLRGVLNEDPVDLHKANEAIDQLANARVELFKTTSQMDLKLRIVLTAQQWQELQSREGRGRGSRSGGRRGRPPQGPPVGSAITKR